MHPTVAQPDLNRNTFKPFNPDEPVTVSVTGVVDAAVWTYLGVPVDRIERFSLDTLRFEFRCTRAERDEVSRQVSDHATVLQLRAFTEHVRALEVLVEGAKISGVYQRKGEQS